MTQNAPLQKIRHAMILGAGFGTRMRHLTQDRPKPMVDLGGRPMIGHVLDRLVVSGIREVVVNVHYHADILEAYLRTRLSPNIHISDERGEILNTGGGVVQALQRFPFLKESPFLLHNSDSVWYENTVNNLDRLMAAWNPEQMDCLMLLARCSTSIGYEGRGDFHLASNGVLTRQSGERPAEFVFAGVSIQNPAAFENCPAGPFTINQIWDKSLAQKRMFGMEHDGIWMHVGTPEALQEAEICLKERQGINC